MRGGQGLGRSESEPPASLTGLDFLFNFLGGMESGYVLNEGWFASC